MTASGALVQDPSCVSPPPQLMVSVRGFAPEPAGVVANFKCIACVDISAPQPCSRSLSLYLGWPRGGSAADVAGASKLRNDDEPRRVISVRMMEIAVPNILQYPLERHRDVQRKWQRLLQRTSAPKVPPRLKPLRTVAYVKMPMSTVVPGKVTS